MKRTLCLRLPNERQLYPGDERICFLMTKDGTLVLGRATTCTDLAAFHFVGDEGRAAELCSRPETVKQLFAAEITAAGVSNRTGQEILSWSSTLFGVVTPHDLRPEITSRIAAHASDVPRHHRTETAA